MKTILIVDDNGEIRRLLASLVNDVADTIVECSGGSVALVAYSRHLPEWALMDIKMSHLDEIAATKKIKAAYADPRIMIVTDYDDTDPREAALRADTREYVVKEDPLSLRRILQGRQVN